jgi:hypothetical protein
MTARIAAKEKPEKQFDSEKALEAYEPLCRPFYYLMYPIAKFLRQKTSITPNMITLLNLAVGILAAFMFISSGYNQGALGMSEYQLRLFGGILMLIYLSLDSLDGQLARAGKMTSRIGAWMDSTFDSIMVSAFILSLAIGTKNNSTLIVGAIAALAFPFQFLFQQSFKLKFSGIIKSSKSILKTKSPLKNIYGTALFHIVVFLATIFNIPAAAIWFFAVFGTLFWLAILLAQLMAIMRMRE